MAARQILDANGLYNIRIEYVAGQLSDHFDPRSNVVRLSDSTYNSTSVAAVGVAALKWDMQFSMQRDMLP